MISPEIHKPARVLMSEETFMRLRDAAKNLFSFGPHADEENPYFGKIVIEDGNVAAFDPSTIRERPSHIYSGKFNPYNGGNTTFEVWRMFEGSVQEAGIVHNGVSIVPATIVREDYVGSVRNRKRLLARTDYVLGRDGQAFELHSTLPPDFMQAEMTREVDEEYGQSITNWFTYVREKAAEKHRSTQI